MYTIFHFIFLLSNLDYFVEGIPRNWYRKLTIDDESFCSKTEVKQIKFNMSRVALLVSAGHLKYHPTQWREHKHCKFDVEPIKLQQSLFALIQKLNFRYDPVNKECIDYVVFRNDVYSSKKICGMRNLTEQHTYMGGVFEIGFVATEGKIQVEIFVHRDAIKPEEDNTELLIAITPFKRLDPHLPCSASNIPCGKSNQCIDYHFIHDGIVNCPYLDCADEFCCDLKLLKYDDENKHNVEDVTGRLRFKYGPNCPSWVSDRTDSFGARGEGKVGGKVKDKVVPKGKDTDVNKVEDTDKAQDKVGGKVDDKVGGEIEDKVKDKVEHKVQDKVVDKVEDKVKDKVEGEVEGEVEDKDKDKVEGEVEDKVGDEVEINVGSKVEDKVEHKVGGDVKVNVGGKVEDKVKDNGEDEGKHKGKEFGIKFWIELFLSIPLLGFVMLCVRIYIYCKKKKKSRATLSAVQNINININGSPKVADPLPLEPLPADDKDLPPSHNSPSEV